MQVIIIGNGITGVTAAISIRQLNPSCKITIISSESEHFYSRTALMYLYMGHMQYQHIKPYEDWFWRENKIDLLLGHVHSINFQEKKINLENKQAINYDKLLIATGSVPNTLAIPGSEEKGIQGFYSLKDLETLEASSKNIKRAVIIGGGLIGIELAEMFYSRCIPVTFLVREAHYWGGVLPAEESKIIENHILSHKIDLKLSTSAIQINTNAHNSVTDIITNTGENIPCDLVAVAIGVKPNISFLENSDLASARGIVVNEYLETNMPDVWAAGDCAELVKNGSQTTVEQLWYTGRMQGQTVARNIGGFKTAYERGIWFNSAKFFDIEYQTYGQIPVTIKENVQTLYWEHRSGMKCLRINFSSDSLAVLGFNLLGIRYRHEVCETWIKEKKDIFYVLKNLVKANFDPEFFRRHEKEINKHFQAQLLDMRIAQNQISAV